METDYRPPKRPSQFVSSQECSAARASLRKSNGPSSGPLLGDISARRVARPVNALRAPLARLQPLGVIWVILGLARAADAR